MSRLLSALLLAAVAGAGAAGAQATPATARMVKERAQRTAAAASARNRAADAPSAQPAAAQPAPAQPAPSASAQPAPAKPTRVANKPSVATPAAPAAADAPPADAPAAKTASPAGRRNRAARPDTVVAMTGPARGDSAVDVSGRGSKGQLSFRRELYAYDGGGRRDPFVSLLANGDLRPDIAALRIATILWDPTGRNSVAILRDMETKEQYRARVGQTLGRMRVTRIEARRVTFIIDEFGFSRQEVLTLETTNERTP